MENIVIEVHQPAGLETGQLTEPLEIVEIEEIESEAHFEKEEQEEGQKIEENEDQDTRIIDSLIEEELKQGKVKKLVIAQWLLCLVLVLSLPFSIWLPKWNKLSFSYVVIWKWNVFLLFLLSGKIIFRCMLRLVILFMEWKFSKYKRLLYYIHGTRSAVESCLWVVSMFALWNFSFSQKLKRSVHLETLFYINKVSSFLLVSSVVWIVKTIVLTYVAVRYNSHILSLRIREMEFSERMIHQIAPKGNSLKKIRNEKGAKNLAIKTVQNLSNNSSRYIYVEDLRGFMNINNARKLLNLLGCASECQKVHKLVLENWVVNIFKERKAIELTRSNSKSIVKKINWILIFVYFIITLIIFSFMFEIITSQDLVFLFWTVILAGFTFGNTCKIAFEAVIHLFVMHPFNIDDRCEIDGVELVVNKINIFSTIFLRNDNQKVIYPNVVLWTKSVSNFRLSPPMKDKIEFDIFILTPEEQIIAMKQKILSFIQSREELWFPTPRIFITSIGETSRLHAEVWATHRINMQDLDERLERKNLLYKEVANIVRELGILVHW
ncbi:Mechanosensitive ion channel domain-containing protein isoform 1 [Theobroma cacao]|uniref:Mechanosensitive ion channel domain-containing protein isoform 1 n=1 Tax=Theobroma cacao TaxID=3641 RepID=A0A061DYT1_THECC|nr:Mechanosensitive ion channel domain-containing protein isoform 1 [Theobroma cacao]